MQGDRRRSRIHVCIMTSLLTKDGSILQGRWKIYPGKGSLTQEGLLMTDWRMSLLVSRPQMVVLHMDSM